MLKYVPLMLGQPVVTGPTEDEADVKLDVELELVDLEVMDDEVVLVDTGPAPVDEDEELDVGVELVEDVSELEVEV